MDSRSEVETIRYEIDGKGIKAVFFLRSSEQLITEAGADGPSYSKRPLIREEPTFFEV